MYELKKEKDQTFVLKIGGGGIRDFFLGSWVKRFIDYNEFTI